MQKFPHTLVKELASYVCLCIDIFAIFWKMFILVIFYKEHFTVPFKQRANAIVTKSHAINIFFHAHSAAVSKWGKAICIFFTYNGSKTRISQLFTSYYIHFLGIFLFYLIFSGKDGHQFMKEKNHSAVKFVTKAFLKRVAWTNTEHQFFKGKRHSKEGCKRTFQKFMKKLNHSFTKCVTKAPLKRAPWKNTFHEGRISRKKAIQINGNPY